MNMQMVCGKATLEILSPLLIKKGEITASAWGGLSPYFSWHLENSLKKQNWAQTSG